MAATSYKEYWIHTMSYRDFGSRRWVPKVRFLRRSGGSRDIMQLEAEHRFASRQESDDHAIAIAMAWIDGA